MNPPRRNRRAAPKKWGWPFLAGLGLGLILSGPLGLSGGGDDPEIERSEVAPEPVPAPAPAPKQAFVGPRQLPFAEQGPPIEGQGPAIVAGRIKPNERIADVLARAGVSAIEIDRALATLAKKVDFRKTRVGDRYEVRPAPEGRIERFEYSTGPLDRWTVARGSNGQYVGAKVEVEIEHEVALVEGEVGSSLYQAFVDAGEKPALAMKLAEVYRFDIDFNTETRRGDRFRLYVEKDLYEGETVAYGNVLVAEYLPAKNSELKKKRLFAFEGQYFDEGGRAARRAFLKSPLRFTRISSAYGYRKHPITKRRHFHGGVDYAAPRGTPVQSVADGVVTFAARKGPNGKMVKVRHAGGYESYYLHLSRIAVKRGQKVTQSTLVGKVGSTGRSTGPHLDFRLKRKNKYINPTKKVVARHARVPRRSKKSFDRIVRRWSARLDAAQLAAL